MKRLTVAKLAAAVAGLEARIAVLEASGVREPATEDTARAGFLSFRQRARAIEDKRLEGREQ